MNYATNTLNLVKCFEYGDVTADPQCSDGTIPYQINDRVGILFTLEDGTNTQQSLLTFETKINGCSQDGFNFENFQSVVNYEIRNPSIVAFQGTDINQRYDLCPIDCQLLLLPLSSPTIPLWIQGNLIQNVGNPITFVQKEFRTQVDVSNPNFDQLTFDFRIICESTLATEERQNANIAR